MIETLKNVLRINPDATFDDIPVEPKKGKAPKKKVCSSEPKPLPETLHSTDLMVNFFDFVEIIFEISQEIDVNRNLSIELKFKNFIEKVILLNIRYRLNLRSKDDGNLHKARLLAELERVNPT